MKDRAIDYVLVIQYRHQIVMKSFFTKYSEQIDKINLINVSMIFHPQLSMYNAENLDRDSIFFIQKDGFAIKIQRLQYFKN